MLVQKGKIKEIELIYDRTFMLSISYEDEKEQKENPSTNRAAIDVGEIHTIAATLVIKNV